MSLIRNILLGEWSRYVRHFHHTTLFSVGMCRPLANQRGLITSVLARDHQVKTEKVLAGVLVENSSFSNCLIF